MPRYCDYIQVPFRRKFLWLTLSAAFLAGGCATLSETECRQADWEALGEAEGARGYPPDRIEEHREACAEYGVVPDRDAYARGRLAGLDRLCTVPGGLAHGRDGRGYQGVCPPGYEEDFYTGFQLGRRIHRVSEDLDDAERAVRQLEFDLQRGDLTDDQRRSIYYRLRNLERDRDSLERELARLEDEARRLLSEL
ncbi:DUF2799 domain-containing protein [Lentisalinibacter salinarum]|uniref:DUF2799 domain-containing protein n=1 Tax=Lentisalinibacter salinarum TaxID=2992239 RepID=UPI003863EF42